MATAVLVQGAQAIQPGIESGIRRVDGRLDVGKRSLIGVGATRKGTVPTPVAVVPGRCRAGRPCEAAETTASTAETIGVRS